MTTSMCRSCNGTLNHGPPTELQSKISRLLLRRLVSTLQLLIRHKPSKSASSKTASEADSETPSPDLINRVKDWTREYPGQEEILDYLRSVATKFNLYPHIRFNSAVESATWDEPTKKWKVKVTTAKGSKDAEFSPEYELKCDFLVSGVGQLNQPRWPNIPGLKDFEGRVMHSARWDWGYELEGKRIAIIGNGECSL